MPTLSFNWPPFHWQRSTLPETNIAPENGWLGYFLVSFEDGLKIQVLLLLVLGSLVFLVKKLHDSFGRISCHVELELFSANNCTCARYRKWTPEENRIEDRSHSLHLTWLFLSFFSSATGNWQLWQNHPCDCRHSYSFSDLVWLNHKLWVLSLQTSAGCRRVICR